MPAIEEAPMRTRPLLLAALAVAFLAPPAAAAPGDDFRSAIKAYRKNPLLRGLGRTSRDAGLYTAYKFGRKYDLAFEVFSHDGQETYQEALGVATDHGDRSRALMPGCPGGLALVKEVFGEEVAADYRTAIMFKETDRRFYQGQGSPDNLFVKQRFIGRSYSYYLQVDEGIARRDLEGQGKEFRRFQIRTRVGKKYLNWYSLTVEPFQEAITKYPWLLERFPQLRR